MATSYRSPPPGTCHTVFSAESEPRGRSEGGGGGGGGGVGRGQTKGKNDKARQCKTMREKLYSNGTTTHSHICWSTADLLVKCDY